MTVLETDTGLTGQELPAAMRDRGILPSVVASLKYEMTEEEETTWETDWVHY